MSIESARKSLSAAHDECASCGICTDTCALLGKERLAIGEVAGRVLAEDFGGLVDVVSRCNLCGRCCVECPSGVNSKQIMLAAREVLVQAGVVSSLGYEGLFTGCDFNAFIDYKRRFSISFEDLARERCDTVFFPGCALSAYSPELVRRVHGWLERRDTTVGVIDSCCGAALTFAGLPARSVECLANLMEELATTGASRVVTSCPNCFYQLKGRLGDVEVVSLSSLLKDARMRVSGSERLTVHDSCPDRFDLTIGNDVRDILSGYELVEMEHSGACTLCCGSGGLVSSADPQRCADLARVRMAEFEAVGAEHLVTACVNCAHRLNDAARAGEVLHYLEMVFDVWIDWVQVNENLRALYEDDSAEDQPLGAPAREVNS
ncbi:MAG: (Fe-S)-binding protein [Coriobacteriia bacterium]|nr:(Fe-S)-binding protein [Coriobacteriia bacterium]